MTRIDIREIDQFIKVLKESKEALELHIIQSKKATIAFSNELKLTGIAWDSTKNHFKHGYGPLLETFDTTAQILTEQFSLYTFAFFQEVTGGYPILDTAQLEDLEIRMQQLASYKVQWLLDMADDLAGIPGIGKFFDELSLESTKKEVILLRKFQEFEHSHRNDFDEVAEALHFLKEGLEAVGNKKNFQGDGKGFSMASYANERWFEKISKFNEDNKDKVAFIKKADATTAAAVAEQTAQIHNAQMNMNRMGDAIMDEVNSTNSYQYNPLGGKTWFPAEEFKVSKKSNINTQGKFSNPVPVEGKGVTGRVLPNTLTEQMAMHQVKSSPLTGATELPIKLSDTRWNHADGWVKMQTVVRNTDGTTVSIHYVFNKISGAFDDFKFK